jgi:hypothetical protein
MPQTVRRGSTVRGGVKMFQFRRVQNALILG